MRCGDGGPYEEDEEDAAEEYDKHTYEEKYEEYNYDYDADDEGNDGKGEYDNTADGGR